MSKPDFPKTDLIFPLSVLEKQLIRCASNRKSWENQDPVKFPGCLDLAIRQEIQTELAISILTTVHERDEQG